MNDNCLKTQRLFLLRPDDQIKDKIFSIVSKKNDSWHRPLREIRSINEFDLFYDNIEDHWFKNNFGHWIIAINRNPEIVIGIGGLSYKFYGTEKKLDLDFRFSIKVDWKSYAVEFGHYAINYAFNVLKKNEIYALVNPKNHFSIKVLHRIGMKQLGVIEHVYGEECYIFHLHS